PQAGEWLRVLGANLLAVNERHERLIDGLLILAVGEQGITDPTPVDLAAIARHVTTESRSAADAARVDLRARLEPAAVSGDPVLLERLIQNLLDNAVRYNLPEDGHATLPTGA